MLSLAGAALPRRRHTRPADATGCRAAPASPMPLPDTLQLLADGAEAGPLPGLIGPAPLHEAEHGVGTQLWAGQAAPWEEDRHSTGHEEGPQGAAYEVLTLKSCPCLHQGLQGRGLGSILHSPRLVM